MGDVAERLWPLFDEFLAAEAVELDDLEVSGRGKGRLLRVVVDAPGGIGVDRIADLSRGLARILDDEDPVDGSYRLEVTSPGLERKLRRPGHYRKSVGREVKVKTTVPVAGATVHQGVLDGVDEDGIVIQLNDGDRRIRFGDVASAKTVFTWEKSPKPGQKRGQR